MKQLFFLFLLLSGSFSFAQLITIDAKYDDWQGIPIQTDPSGDASNLDLLEFSVTNDAEYLFLRVKTAEEFGLMNPPYTNSQLHLFLDTDHDAATGDQSGNLGAELKVIFGDKGIQFHYPQAGAYSGSLYDIGMRAGPTVTGNEFEIAIRRDAKPDGQNSLFRSDSLRLYFYSTGNDFMPNSGSFFTYTFENGPFPSYSPIELTKDDSKYIRLFSYNVERGGLIDQSRDESFERILQATGPDLVGFTETQGTAPEIKKLMDVWLPTGGGWHTASNGGNMIASRFPLTFSGAVYPGDSRAVAGLIDLPDGLYAKDLLFIAAHPSCCANDAARQEQIDKIVNYILDAQSPGGRVNVPPQTPIAIVGDFNLVGWRQQLQTLLQGDIQNTGTYGPGGPMDWDGSEMEDASCLHTETPMFFTWRSPTSPFGPGKLDYIFYSGSVMELKKSYTLDTDEMHPANLAQWGLNKSDTDIASDHLPLVADVMLEEALAIDKPVQALDIFPNPASHSVYIQHFHSFPATGNIVDIHGKMVMQFDMKNAGRSLDISTLPTGIYLLSLHSGGQVFYSKLLKK